jgi:hypothetical protein
MRATEELEIPWRAQVTASLGSVLSLHDWYASGCPSTPTAALVAATATLMLAGLSSPVSGVCSKKKVKGDLVGVAPVLVAPTDEAAAGDVAELPELQAVAAAKTTTAAAPRANRCLRAWAVLLMLSPWL